MRLGAEMYYVLHFVVGHLFVVSHGTKMYSTPLHTVFFPLERKKGIASFYCNSVGLFTPPCSIFSVLFSTQKSQHSYAYKIMYISKNLIQWIYFTMNRHLDSTMFSITYKKMLIFLKMHKGTLFHLHDICSKVMKSTDHWIKTCAWIFDCKKGPLSATLCYTIVLRYTTSQIEIYVLT